MTTDDTGFDREELREAIRTVLDQESGSEQVREHLDDEDGYAPKLWSTMGELGWKGIAIPEQYGGGGASWRELGVILEELGRYVTPSPFISTVVLGAGALLLGGTEEQRSKLLPGIASGQTIATAALTGPNGRCDVDCLDLRVREEGKELLIEGTAGFVPDAQISDWIILAARDPGGKIQLFWTERDRPGIEISVKPTYDQTRRLARIEVHDLRLPRDNQLTGGDGATVREQLFDWAAAALACDSSGGTQRALEMTVEYVKQRTQFNRPIGSFQAVKHRCADLMTLVETSRVAAEHAVESIATGSKEVRTATSEAKFYSCDAYAFTAGDAIQLHGGGRLHLGVRLPPLPQARQAESGTVWRLRLAPRPSCGADPADLGAVPSCLERSSETSPALGRDPTRNSPRSSLAHRTRDHRPGLARR